MLNKLSKRTDEVKFSPIREIFDLASRTPGLTRLEVGQPDFNTPDYILDEGKKVFQEGFIGYTPTNGLPQTRQAVSNRLKKDYDIDYDYNSEIAITIGASGALYQALRALVNVGDEVLRPDPGFASYDGIIKDADGVPVLYPLIPEEGFAIDFDKLESLVTDKTKVMILNSPGNPTGSILDQKQIIRLNEFAERHDIIILSDEAYDKIIFDKEHIPTVKGAKNKYRVVTIGSASKDYAMCGCRVGFAAGDPKIIAEIVKFQSLSSICPSYVAQRLYAVALNGPQENTKNMKNEYMSRRDYFIKALNEIRGFKCITPEGAFYAFVDISSQTNDDWSFTRNLIENVKVTCIPGSSFGSIGKGFVRFSYATSMEVLQEAITKMKKAFN